MKDFLALFTKRFNFPKKDAIENAIRSFSLTEKIIFWFFVAIFIFSGIALLEKVSLAYQTEVPAHGGELTEGVIGTPRFVNPLLAMSDTDKDLVALTYSGLLKAGPDGTLVTDLADHYSISPDGLTYDFVIRKDATFQDGTPVTAQDVAFTIAKAEDPIIKSPMQANWDGVTVHVVNDHEIQFILKQPYGPFLDNTTLGILPEHIWSAVAPEQFPFSKYNITPIGSGPYEVSGISQDSNGIPSSYTLKSFPHYISGEPYISTFTMKFYQNENDLINAYNAGSIESVYGFSAQTVHGLKNDNISIIESVLPRIFGVFFNQNQAHVLANNEVRLALDQSLDKAAIVKEVLFGYGATIDGPIPPKTKNYLVSTTTEVERLAIASTTLAKAGWKISSSTGIWQKKTKSGTQTLAFSIATGDTPELKAVANIIKNDWTALGAQVDVQVYESGDLNQNIIRPRKYDALLFGEIIGRSVDLYPFWHSTERNDPGLNIALYVNSAADKLLEKARATSDFALRDSDYAAFQQIIQNDKPAIFVYSPSFLYILPKKVMGVNIDYLTVPSERFASINQWYVETNHIWNIFIKH
jgi:peptide/nickel transport system substrate-binding protein